MKFFSAMQILNALLHNYAAENERKKMKSPNQLINETSPYLLQHAFNPVNWSAWNEVAWQQAKMEDKLVVVSIGYSACHWCHVMEHESFEDVEVAELMNRNFISIKVDREERPDVDQVYMDAVQIISGRGGWPLNAICLPDGRPVYAGTYFPKQNWIQLLQFFVHEYQRNREKMLERATGITNGIRTMEEFEPNKISSISFNEIEAAFQSLLATQDHEFGGRAGAPKFPMPVNYLFLLEYFVATNEESALKTVTNTLDRMLLGGIYDQVGGGFARYSVDAYWEIPHFEKMLYDNAQLVSLYAKAYSITKDEHYKRVVSETLHFIERELTASEGNFFSALDADSEGEEGRFYVWDFDELKMILGNEWDDFRETYHVSAQGNFEGRNHLTRKSKVKGNETQIERWRSILLQERSKRIRPNLDDKTLTSWNALMMRAYVDAYNALGYKKYLLVALKNVDFILKNQLKDDGSVLRNYKAEKSSISGFLDDYAFLIDALIAVYETTFEEVKLLTANRLTQYVIEHFWDEGRNIFFYTNKTDAPLVVRKTETSDNVIPSSNSLMAKNLLRLSLIYDNGKYKEMAKAMLQNVFRNVQQHASFYANWASLMLMLNNEPFVVAICGHEANLIRAAFNHAKLPLCIFIGSKNGSQLPLLKDKHRQGETLIYVCKNNTCGIPAKTVEAAVAQMV